MTDRWPEFFKLLVKREPTDTELSWESLARGAALGADAMDAEYRRRQLVENHGEHIPLGDVRSLWRELRIKGRTIPQYEAEIRREERERVLEEVCSWLQDTDTRIDRLGRSIHDAIAAGRFDPPEGR